MTFTEAASTTDIQPDQMKGIKILQKEILVTNIGGTYSAIENRCTHLGCLLSNGTLE